MTIEKFCFYWFDSVNNCRMITDISAKKEIKNELQHIFKINAAYVKVEFKVS